MIVSHVELAVWVAIGATGLVSGLVGLAGARRRMAAAARQEVPATGRDASVVHH